MASNEKKIIEFYSSYQEENRAAITRSGGIEFHYTKKMLSAIIKPDSCVLEVGCGTGYYGMFFSDRCRQYTGIDLSPDHIAAFNQKINDGKKQNVRAMVGDATCLSGAADDSYDVVLCLGPMYHLQREEREKVFRQCRRVAKPGAMLAFAYINRIGVYAGACIVWPDAYPNDKTNQYVFEYNTDDDNPGVFIFTSPEEMEQDAEKCGLQILKNRGLDFFFAKSVIDGMTEEQYECYLKFADQMNESPSCVGLANHAMLVCRK